MQTTSPKITTIPVKFRFPIKQVGDFYIEVQIPTSPLGTPILNINEKAADELKLTDAEFEKASIAATQAALRAIMIIE